MDSWYYKALSDLESEISKLAMEHKKSGKSVRS